MPTFNAGSIEARLTLDRSAFTEGLDIARAQADEFAANDIEITVNADTTDAELQLGALRDVVDELDGRDVDIDVNVRGAAEGEAELAALRASTDEASRSVGSPGGGAGGGLLGRLGLMPLAIGALLPVIGPLAGEAAGAGIAFGIAGAGLGSFVAALIPAIGPVKDAAAATSAYTKAVDTYGKGSAQAATALQKLHESTQALTPLELKLLDATQGLEGAFKRWGKSLEPATLPPLIAGLHLLRQIMPELTPLVQATGTALTGVIHTIGAGLTSSGFKDFITFLSQNIGPVLHAFAVDFVQLGQGVATFMENGMPLVQGFLGLLNDVTQGLQNMAQSTQFLNFVSQMQKAFPVLNMALRHLADAVGNIIVALGPAVIPVLHFIDLLATSISSLAKGGAISSIARLFGSIVNALAPLLPLIATLANTLIPPLANALNILVSQGIAPFLAALVNSGSIQNLASALADLMVAITPILPPLAHFLTLLTPAVAGAINLVAQLIDDIAKNKVVVDILLGIAAAWAAWTIAAWALDAALDANPIGAVILALVVLAVAIDQLVRHWDKVVKFLHGPWGTALSFAVAALVPFIGIPMLIIGHWKQIIGFFSGLWNAVSGFFEHNWRTIVRVLADIILWPLVIVKYWSHIVGFFSGLWHDIERIFSAAIHWVGNEINNLPGQIARVIPEMISKGEHMMHGFWNAIKRVASSVMSWFKGLPHRIVSAVGDLRRLLWNAGMAVIHGLIGGIESAAKAIPGIIGKIGGGISGAFHSVMGILSPSKVMAESVGAPIMQGVFKGMNDNMHLVDKTALTFRDKVTDSFMLRGPAPAMAGGYAGYTGSGYSRANSEPAPVNLYLDPQGTQRLARVVKQTNDKQAGRRS